jgi:pimeloyl-ACP methyl ester carboxylesterase
MKANEFKIDVPNDVLDDLNDRLSRTRWPDEITGTGWEYGTNKSYLEELVSYWRNRYEWRSNEKRLNGFAQFKTEIDGVTIHFIHEKGKGPNPMPILLTHGWPDSFLRFEKLIPMLIDPAGNGGDPNDSFDVIVPSLPGFGFSSVPQSAGNIFSVPDLWAKLMTDVLGYPKFAAHGGDWGSIISENLARHHAKAMIGIHLTDVPFTHTFQKPDDLSPAEKKYLDHMEQWQQKNGAYNMIQGSRPETLASVLNDSPAGLAAWIVEKFQSMNGCDGQLEKCFTKDQLLTNITLYWVTQSIGTSFLPYYDLMNAGALTWIGEKLKDFVGSADVPTGFAMFADDNSHPPREWAERFFNVQRWSQLPQGGHFAALERPEDMAIEIRTFFKELR